MNPNTGCLVLDYAVSYVLYAVLVVIALGLAYTFFSEWRGHKQRAVIQPKVEKTVGFDFAEYDKRQKWEAMPEEYREIASWRARPARNEQEFKEFVAKAQEQYAKSAKVKAHYLDQEYQDRCAAIDVERVQVLLDELSALGSKLRMFDVSLNLDEPRVVERIWPKTREYMVLSMTINELNGEFSVSKLERAFKPYNDHCEWTGQRKLRITQKLIRDVGQKYTSNDRNSLLERVRPFQLIHDDVETRETYLLMYVHGNRRKVIAIEELARSVNA